MADGIDPSAERQERRTALLDTFEGVGQEWLELQTKSLAPETISILGARLKSALYPYLGSKPVAAITAQELLGALRRIEARGLHETAHRSPRRGGESSSLCGCHGTRQHDVAADLKDALAPVKSKNFASVTDPKRVGELMRAIHGYQRPPPVTAFRPEACFLRGLCSAWGAARRRVVRV